MKGQIHWDGNQPQTEGTDRETKVNLTEKLKDSSCLCSGTDMPKIQYAVVKPAA